jgi:hypothetical protein
MAMSCFVLAAAFYGVFTVNRWTFSIFLFLQASSTRCAVLLVLSVAASTPVASCHVVLLQQTHVGICCGVSLARVVV